MIGYFDASNALTLMILLMGASFLHLSSPNPINAAVDVKSQHQNAPHEKMVSEDEERRNEEKKSVQKKEAEEEELFKDVDPKTLAAVLLEALNRSQVERKREGEEHDGMGEDSEAERGEVKKKEGYTEVTIMEKVDRARDGRQELELLVATQGKDQEKEEEEERKAQKEEEMMTEKVTSRTTSQTVQVQTKHQPTSPKEKGGNGKGAALQQGPTSPEPGSNEEEEQLSPEELKNLETMMKEFPRLNTATKREGDSKQNQRESRGYSNYNEIIPVNEGRNLAMSKKKMKWQEETQKALNFPTFEGGNYIDDIVDSSYDTYAVQSQAPVVEMKENEPEKKKEEDEEVLGPEEEEAQAKAEQEEMRRQAAEAQRAKMEEEKLADLASDMLLRYMVKQNNGNKKHSLFLSNTAEDKRSNEEQEVTEEDDVDPQTIDKLIEISSKLHLPADDVVDIISDVEKKKKKKDMPAEIVANWQQAPSLPSLFSFTNGFSISQISDNKNNYPFSKQPSPTVSLLKNWFSEKTPTKSQDHWVRPAKPLLVNPIFRPKPWKPLSVEQDRWLKLPASDWTDYASYPYLNPSYYQPYPQDYPYFPPPTRTKPHFYIHKPALHLNTFLRNTVDNIYTFPPKPRYHSWDQPWPRKPPVGLQQKPYYTSYPFPVSISKPYSLPRMPGISLQRKQFYYPALVSVANRNKDYHESGKQIDGSTHEDREKCIDKIFMKRPKMMD